MRADTIGIGQDQIVAWSGADGDRRLDRRRGRIIPLLLFVIFDDYYLKYPIFRLILRIRISD
ncbi:MAG: hypothetical protein WAT76_10615 [Dokdonella sp.]